MKGVKLSINTVRRKLKGGVRTYTAYRITIPSRLIQRLGWDTGVPLLLSVEEKDGRKVLVIKPVAPT